MRPRTCTIWCMGRKRPPRLSDFDYVGFHRYFLTICTHGKLPAFSDLDAGRAMAMNFLHYADAEGFAVIAYCLMPDHVHALVKGLVADADLRHFVRFWKQRSGFQWKKQTGVQLWQEGYFDRALRPEETDLFVIGYIAMNPVDAGLAQSPFEFPLFGYSHYTRDQIQIAIEEFLRSRN
jgi:putative transposase